MIEICNTNDNLYVLYQLLFRLFLDNIDSFFFYPDSFSKNN